MSNVSKEEIVSLELGLVESLRYLYTELLRHDLNDLADILEKCIGDCTESVDLSASFSNKMKEEMEAFRILKNSRKLSLPELKQLIKEMDRFEVNQDEENIVDFENYKGDYRYEN